MKLKIIYNLKIYEIECDVDEPIENLKALIEIEVSKKWFINLNTFIDWSLTWLINFNA